MSYSQIVDSHPTPTYLDIFRAAEEALELVDVTRPLTAQERTAIRAEHPRAYEPWSEDEEGELKSLHDEGASISEIAEHLGRQPSAVESRLRKLGLR